MEHDLAPQLSNTVRAFVAQSAAPRELVGFFQHLRHHSSSKAVPDRIRPIVLLALRDVVEATAQRCPWEQLAGASLCSELTACMKCLLQASVVMADTNILSWAKHLFKQTTLHGHHRSRPTSAQANAVLKAMAFPLALAKMEALQQALRGTAGLQVMKAVEVVAHAQDWALAQLQGLVSEEGATFCQEQPPPTPKATQRLFAILFSEAPGSGKQALQEGVETDTWRLLLQHCELQAFEAIRRQSRSISRSTGARDNASVGALSLYRLSLHCQLLAGGCRAGVIDAKQHRAYAITCAKLVVELVKGGGLACTPDAAHVCQCHIPVRLVLALLDRVTADLEKEQPTTPNSHVDLARLRMLQVEVSATYQKTTASEITGQHATQALSAWRSHLKLEALVGVSEVAAVVQCVHDHPNRDTQSHQLCSIELMSELSDAADLLELLGLSMHASEAVALALASLGYCWWHNLQASATAAALLDTFADVPLGNAGRVFGVKMLYRQVMYLVDVSVGAFSENSITLARAAARSWWSLAEAGHEQLADMDVDAGLLSNLELYRAQAAAMLPDFSQSNVPVPSASQCSVKFHGEPCANLFAAEALQVGAETAFQWQQSGLSEDQLNCGAEVAIRASRQALDMLRQHGSIEICHASGKDPWAMAVQRCPASRCISLHLRALLQMGLGYERFGLPHYADYYYNAGLRYLIEQSCGSAMWRLRFLCARARLALGGFSCQALPDMHQEALSNGNSCRSIGDPLLDLESFWNSELQGKPRLKLVDCVAVEVSPDIASWGSWCGPPLVLVELQSLVAGQDSLLTASNEATQSQQEWEQRAETFFLPVRGNRKCSLQQPIGSSGDGFSHLSHSLWNHGKRKEWRRCALYLASAIPTDAGMPFHASVCSGLLSMASAGANECTDFFRDDTEQCQDIVAGVSRGLEQCEVFLKGRAESEWRFAIREALLSLGGMYADGGPASVGSTSDMSSMFTACLTLTIAAMQCGVRAGHSTVVRKAAYQVAALAFDAAEWLSHVELKAAARLGGSDIGAPLKRQRIHQYADAHDKAFNICAAAVPLCSGMSVFLLHELRATQRANGNNSSANFSKEVSVDDGSTGNKYIDSSWLAELPGDVTVAWLQYDRAKQCLQISRKVDGPHCSEIGNPLVLRRIPLSGGLFEGLEAEFQNLQSEHHSRVSSHVQRDDCNDANQRKVFWADRDKSDCQLERLAGSLQSDLLQEWRFLLMPWAREAGVRSRVSAQFKSWWKSEAAIAKLGAHLQKDSSLPWILSLLYWGADWMQQTEVSSVLASLLRTSGMAASELNRLAGSLKSHRTANFSKSCRSEAQMPLLIFVDSDVAQFPLEACPCLRSLEVVRAVAPNVCLTAFQRQRSSAAAAARAASASSTATSTLIRTRRHTAASPSPPLESSFSYKSPQGGFFVLDPLKDPTCGQLQLRRLLQSLNDSGKHGAWAGHVGQPFPETSEVLQKLKSEDVFLYMGHGQCARKLLKPDLLQMGAPASHSVGNNKSAGSSKSVALHSVVMLMGCSTAKMLRTMPVMDMDAHASRRRRAHGGVDFEAFGMPLNVLVGGSPAMVGALWDVLGGDLEQLVCSLLEGWVGGAQSQKQMLGDSSHATPTSLMSNLVKAREACRLSFLTGAAMVCYGIPV